MPTWISTAVALFLAAALEVGGDAIVRHALHSTDGLAGRIVGFALGAAVLFVYSLSVNAPKWDFGRLLGVYIALFYVVAQLAAVFVFKETLKLPTVVAGVLIVGGGVVLTVWQGK